MSICKEEERQFGRRLEGYIQARDAILARWKAACTEYLPKSSFNGVPEEERQLYRETYDFLLSHGAINFGCVQPPPRGPGEPEENVLSERNIVLGLYEILRAVDFQTTTEKAIRKQLAEKLGSPMDAYKRLINKHVNFVVENQQDRETLQPLGFGEGEEGGGRRPQSVVVVGAGPAGLAAASTLKKCGVQVTVLEARHAHGGRCITAHSTNAGESDGGAANGGGQGPWHLGELAPLPLMLLPKGVADSEGGLASRRAAVELLEVLGQQQGIDVAEEQVLREGGPLFVSDPSTGEPVPVEKLCASSQLLQELLLSCQFAAHQPSLRAAIDEALQERLDKAGEDVSVASAAVEAAAAAMADTAAAMAEAACYDDIAAATAAAVEGLSQGKEGSTNGEDGGKPTGGDEEQEQQQQQADQRLEQLLKQQEEQQAKAEAHRQEQALADAIKAQQELQESARILTWQLCGFELYAGVSLCALLPPAAVHLGAAVVPTGMAPGAPSVFSSLFPVGGHPKPMSLPSGSASAAAAGASAKGDTPADRRAAAGLQGSIMQGLGHEHLDIKLGDPAVSITYGKEQGVTVTTQSGAQYKAGVAILAVPLGVLQAGTIALEPPLPIWKVDAHTRLGTVSSMCVTLEYEDAFWRRGGQGKLFGVLPQAIPPPCPPADELSTESSQAVVTAAAAAAEAGGAAASGCSVAATRSLGWLFEEVAGPTNEGHVVVLAHVLAAPGTQASKLPDAALQQAAAEALHSCTADAACGLAGRLGGSLECSVNPAPDSVGDGSIGAGEEEAGSGGDADFSDFAHFEQITAEQPAPAERKLGHAPPPLQAVVSRWDGANKASGCRACSLHGSWSNGLVGEDEDEGLLVAAAAAPLQEALLFAGEHTVEAGLVGSVSGALLSGAREAARAYKLLLQLRMGGEVVDLEVLDEVILDTGKLKADAKARDKERRQAVKQKQKERAKAAKTAKDQARKAAAAAANKRKKEEEDDAPPEDEEETSDSESETDVEREVKKPRRKKGEGKRRSKRARSSVSGSEGETAEKKPREKKPKKEKVPKGPSTRRKKSPSEAEAEPFIDPIRYEELQAKRSELRNFLKSVHKAVINAAKENVQPFWELTEASESIESRSQIINVLQHVEMDALKPMGEDVPLLRIWAEWVQDLSQEASNEHLLLSLFKVFERLPCRVQEVKESGLLGAVKKLRGNDARKETRAGANELWSVWDRRFRELNRQAAIASAQAAQKASMAVDSLLGLGSTRHPLGGSLLPPPQQQQQQQQQQQHQPEVEVEPKPQGVSVEQLDEEDRARIQALEAKLAEEERLAQEAEELRRQEQEQAGGGAAPKLPRIPTFDEYAKKWQMKREKEKARKPEIEEDVQGAGVEAEVTAPVAAAGSMNGVPSPLYNIVTKMLSVAVSKGELQKNRFKVMREKIIAKIASGKSEAEVHSETYVRQNFEKIKRLVKGYIEAKQSQGGKGAKTAAV